jgi:hypothetical protein
VKKKVRENFRNAVFKRDGNKCRVCDNDQVKLDAHHITDRSEMPNGGYVVENGITLCDTSGGCHMKAEQYHLGNEVEEGFHPIDLYKLIKSSYELAYKKSI